MAHTDTLDIEQLKQAARLRYMEMLSWEAIGDALNVSARTIWNYRQKEAWAEAVDCVVREMQAELRPKAYAALMRTVDAGDVAAIKEALNRIEGAIAQKTELTGKDGGAVQTEQKHSGRIELTGDAAAAVLAFHEIGEDEETDAEADAQVV